MCAVKNVMKFNYHSRTTSINKKKHMKNIKILIVEKLLWICTVLAGLRILSHCKAHFGFQSILLVISDIVLLRSYHTISRILSDLTHLMRCHLNIECYKFFFSVRYFILWLFADLLNTKAVT